MFTPVRGENSNFSTHLTVINLEAGLDDFNPRSLQHYPRGNNVPSTSDTVSFEKKISGFSSENVKNFRMEFDFFLFLPKSYN